MPKASRKPELTVVGSVALDSVRSPYGQSVRALGGSAVYFSLAAQHFCSVRLVGVVGNDFPQSAQKLLQEKAICLKGLQVQEGKTFHWQGYYTENLNQAITEKTELNVFIDFKPILCEEHISSPYLFLANIDPRIQWECMSKIRSTKWIACDTMNYWIESAKNNLTKVLKKVDICLMNDAEVRQYTGEYNLAKAMKALKKIGPQIILIKRGEHGVTGLTPNGFFTLPALLLEDLSDPTGAGDSFAGGFLGYLTQFAKPQLKQIKEAALYGTIIASYNVQSFSVKRLAELTRKDIQKRYVEFRDFVRI